MRLALKIGHVYRFYNQPTAKFHTEVTLPAEHSLEKLAKLFDYLLSTANRKLLNIRFFNVWWKILIFRRRRKKIAKDSEDIWVLFAKCIIGYNRMIFAAFVKECLQRHHHVSVECARDSKRNLSIPNIQPLLSFVKSKRKPTMWKIQGSAIKIWPILLLLLLLFSWSGITRINWNTLFLSYYISHKYLCDSCSTNKKHII